MSDEIGSMQATLHFKDKLKDVVARKGLTQPETIRILGRSSVRTVQDWIAGRRTPHRDVQDIVLLKLMKARAARTKAASSN